jgi:hypothetical protein
VLLKKEAAPGTVLPFAFVCFEDPENPDKTYGYQAAQRATEELHDQYLVGDKKLYVKGFLNK